MSSNSNYIFEFFLGKDVEPTTKASSYTAKYRYIRQWLGIEEPETFEAREEGLEGAETKADSGNVSEFSEVSPVVAWAVWQNSRSSPEGMDHEETEKDYDNASEFSEIPLALVFQNSISSGEITEDDDLNAYTEIEDDLLSQFSEVSLSHLWPNAFDPIPNAYDSITNAYDPIPNTYDPIPNAYDPIPNAYDPIPNPATNLKVEEEKEDFSAAEDDINGQFKEPLTENSEDTKEKPSKRFEVEVNPAEIFEKRCATTTRSATSLFRAKKPITAQALRKAE
ncbi:hypothetical protein RUND412_003150 [Rhizina undulata]